MHLHEFFKSLAFLAKVRESVETSFRFGHAWRRATAYFHSRKNLVFHCL